MSFLVRKLAHGKEWSAFKLKAASGGPSDPPPWIYTEFAPRPNDKDWLSFFSATNMDPQNLVGIAGAMDLFSGVDAGGSRQFYVGASVDEIKSIGLAVKQSSGQTMHKVIDGLHWEVQVSNMHELHALSMLMWGKVPSEIKGQKITEQQKKDAGEGLIAFNNVFRSTARMMGHEEYGLSYLRKGVIAFENC